MLRCSYALHTHMNVHVSYTVSQNIEICVVPGEAKLKTTLHENKVKGFLMYLRC